MSNYIMPFLFALASRPYHAVSKPTLQAWARYRPRGGRLLGRVLQWTRAHMVRYGHTLASEFGGGTVGAEKDAKSTALREEAAAKFLEANNFIEAACKTAGISMEDLKGDESKVGAEVLEKFDAIMAEGHDLREQYTIAAKSEGRWEGLRQNYEYFHEKATGKPLPWGQVTEMKLSGKTLGQQFVSSETYRELVDSGVLHSEGASFKSSRITSIGPLNEVIGLQKEAADGDQKATDRLTEMKAASDLIYSGTPSSGADALILDQFLPGILQLPQRPLTIRELFASGQATSDNISYAAQTAFDDAAATVAQATATDEGAKPQSSVAWARRTKPVETIATYMAATRQQLADAPQVQSLIDNQGRLMLQLEEEDQLISGDGSTPNLKGVLNETGVQTLVVAVGADADAAGLLNLKSIRSAKRMAKTGTARVSADAVVMHPNDSEEFDLLTDGNSLFRGGNPVGNFNFNQSLWGLRRVESEAIPEGTVLVGAFIVGATVLERMPITVYTTDSHSDWFIRNLIAVLFEERLGFPIFYPSAFVKITLNLWAGGS